MLASSPSRRRGPPAMQLMIKDVAVLLDVPERIVHTWISRREIPVHRIGEQFRFSRDELIEWAAGRDLDTARLVGIADGTGARELGRALRAGGIHHGIQGTNKHEILEAMVSKLPIPDESERANILQMVVAREKLSSTGIGGGIAIPHVRSPIVLDIAAAAVVMGLLEHPVDFGAIDAKPVGCVLLLVTPTVHAHLRLLSRLAQALADPRVAEAIRDAAPAERILAEIERVEA
jgi:PTS system nitrogen regulatory IIA component